MNTGLAAKDMRKSAREDFAKEVGRDEILEPVVINLQDVGTGQESDEDRDVTGPVDRCDKDDNDIDDDTLLAVPLS
jgi:hypothetical protein